MQKREISLREELICAGIKSLTIGGTASLSIRKLAKDSGVSCAAPFKHFKDKQEFYQEIASSLDQTLMEQLQAIAEADKKSLWNIYVEVSISYIEYLVAHPFLMDLSFWQSIRPDKGSGLREWKSFQFVIWCYSQYRKHLNLSVEENQRIYFSMQTLTYGLPYMAIASLLNPEIDYKQYMRVEMESIFKDYPRI